MATVLTSSTFSVDSIVFGKHKVNINSGFNIDISVGDNKSEKLIQTPKMRCPFGLSSDKTNPYKKSVDISFQGEESSESIKSFRGLVDNMDDLVIDYALKNSKTFFKKELSREVLKEYYYSGIKVSKKEQYSDTFKMKLQYLKPNPEKNLPNGKYLTSFWNQKGEEQSESYLDKGDSVTCLIKPYQLWVTNRSFGVTWICTQLRIHKQVKNTAYAFKKTDEEDIDSGSEEEVEVEESDEEVEVDA